MAKLQPAAGNPRKALVRHELLTKAAEVFEVKGFAQTRIQDIAEEMDLSRSALYHYFQSKEEILSALVEEHTSRRAGEIAVVARDATKPAAERVRLALHQTIMERLTGGPRLRVLDRLALEMPPDIRAQFDRGRRRILNLYVQMIDDGVKSGEFRPLDASITALAVLGIASWTSWWYSPKGSRKPEELAGLLVDFSVNGLLARSVGQDSGAKARLVDEIRVRLDHLEAL